MRGPIQMFGQIVLAAGLCALPVQRAVAVEDDDAARLIPQSRAPQTNARRAIGDDEGQGVSILDSVPAFSRLAAAQKALQQGGIQLRGAYIGDPYANLGGGLRRAGAYAGRLDIQLDADLGTLGIAPDTTIHANMYQIHGRDLSREAVGNLLSTNDIAALPTTRLYELYLSHDFGDKVSVRAGQIGIDVEFLTSDYAANFINATFGWPGLPSLDLPEGGPAYPLATPALRVRYRASEQLALLAAVFDGEPAGPGPGDPQQRDRYGLNFRVGDPPLIFAEAQYRYNQADHAKGLPGTVKLGAFAHLGRFDDLRSSDTGPPLAGGVGTPFVHRGNAGVYGILDQQVYRASEEEPQRGIGVFARVIAAPADRNLVDRYADAGFAALGLVPGRPADFFGVAGAYLAISPAAGAENLDTALATGRPGPICAYEAVLEMSYSAQVVPGLALQPTFEYVVHPGASIAYPTGGGAIRNAKVFGITTTIRF